MKYSIAYDKTIIEVLKGVLPILAPAKVNVVVSGYKVKETWNHSLHLFNHTCELRKGCMYVCMYVHFRQNNKKYQILIQ